MTTIELFEEVFEENVFADPRTQERTDKRCGAYLYMKKVMGMGHVEIGREIGRSHSTVGLGAKRFEGLLEIGDKSAENIWRIINERVDDILAYTDGELLTIEGEVDYMYTSKKIIA